MIEKTASEYLLEHFISLPHCQAIDLRFEELDHKKPILSIPWRADLVGRNDTNTIHGGVITTLVDVVSASAVAARLPDFEVLATLDMRIDYMHPATPGDRVYAKAECYRLAGQVAFVRAHCYQPNEADPIALGTAAFMRTPLPAADKAALQQYLQQEWQQEQSR